MMPCLIKMSSFKIGPLELGVSLSLMVQSTSQLFVVDGHEVDAAACKHLCHVMHSEQNRCVCLSEYRTCVRCMFACMCGGMCWCMTEVDPAVLEVLVRECAQPSSRRFLFMPGG